MSRTTTTCKRPMIDMPKPKSYLETSNAKEPNNFLWSLKEYFKPIECFKYQYNHSLPYGHGDVVMRRKHSEIKKGMCTINTFNEFKQDLKDSLIQRMPRMWQRADSDDLSK